MRKTFLGLDVVRHPWLAGQLWAVLFCAAVIVIEAFNGHPVPLAGFPSLFGLSLLGGLAFGAGMSILAKSAHNRGDR